MRATIAFRLLCGALLALSAQQYTAAQASNPAAQQRARQWYEYYDEGVRAVQEQRWQQAIDNLLAAQKARPQQSRRVVFYGDRIDAYVPDYYLGLAYTSLGRFQEADAAFQRVTAQKLVVASDRTFQTLQAQAARARTGLAAAAGRGQQSPVQTAANNAPPPPPGGGGAAAPVQSPVQSPIQSPTQAPESTVAAAPVTTAPVPAAAPPDAAPTPAASAAQTAPAVPRPQGPGIVNRPATAGRAAPAAAAPAVARASERDGIAAFYGGDYASAARILEAVVASDGKAAPLPTPRARLFLASSVAAQVVVGERARTDLEMARAQLAQAGALTQFAADRPLISPRIWAALGAQP